MKYQWLKGTGWRNVGVLCLQRIAVNEKLIICESAEVNFGQKPFDSEELTPAALVAALVPG